MQTLDRGRLQAVAIPMPVGDEMAHVAAEQLNGPPEHDRGRDAIDVVVAVDDDALAAGDGAQNAIDGLAHAGQQHRVVQLGDVGIQEGVGPFRIGEAPLRQQARNDRRNAERGGRPRHFGGVGRHVLPDAVHHQPARSGRAGATLGVTSMIASDPMARNFS
jgi:hypothetical protein